MENNNTALWLDIIAHEHQYFRTQAKYLLLKEGILWPSEHQIQNKLNYLFHSFFSFLALLNESLSSYEVESFIKTLRKHSVKKTAYQLGMTTFSVKTFRCIALEKLCFENRAGVIYQAMRFGYFPFLKFHT